MAVVRSFQSAAAPSESRFDPPDPGAEKRYAAFNEMPRELRDALNEAIIDAPLMEVYRYYLDFGLSATLRKLRSSDNQCLLEVRRAANPIHKMSNAEIMAMLDKMER